MEQNTLKTTIQKTGVDPAKVIVPNYVSFFNVDKDNCVLAGPAPSISSEKDQTGFPISQQHRKDINGVIQQLNIVIADNVEAAGAVLLPVDRPGGPFDQHRFCDDNLPYFTSFTSWEDYRQYANGNLFIGRMWRPNPDGYNLYKDAILEAIKPSK